MKTILLPFLLLVFLQNPRAQQKIFPGDSTSTQGYWVIETNKKTPGESIVHFYTANHQLMYRERVRGKKIHRLRPATVRCLNAALKECELAWKQDKKFRENGNLLAGKF